MNSSDHLLAPNSCPTERVNVLERFFKSRHSHKINSFNTQLTRNLAEISVIEDEENPYYKNVLDFVANDSVGSMPQILVTAPNTRFSDSVEDSWAEWGSQARIGEALRQIRRGACRTGLGIGIPYQSAASDYPHKLRIKTICRLDLKTPINDCKDARGNLVEFDRKKIHGGIEFNEHSEIVKIYVDDGDRSTIMYEAKDILIFNRMSCEGQTLPVPECHSAFSIYPSIREYIESVFKRANFEASIPMFMKLSDAYPPQDTKNFPKGYMEYRPGYIPTLPPGVSIDQINTAGMASDRRDMLRTMVSAAARCVSLPANLAFGDSMDSNMSSSQVDRETWENWIKIDRYDYSYIIRKVVKLWYDQARFIDGYVAGPRDNQLSYDLSYPTLFNHPDPWKRTNAVALQLATGQTNLARFLSSQGRNPRRELEKGAALLGISVQDLVKLYISQAVNNAYEFVETDSSQ